MFSPKSDKPIPIEELGPYEDNDSLLQETLDIAVSKGELSGYLFIMNRKEFFEKN